MSNLRHPCIDCGAVVNEAHLISILIRIPDELRTNHFNYSKEWICCACDEKRYPYARE